MRKIRVTYYETRSAVKDFEVSDELFDTIYEEGELPESIVLAMANRINQEDSESESDYIVAEVINGLASENFIDLM